MYIKQAVRIALAPGDGSGPEMMAQAVLIAQKAAELDHFGLEFVETPMGWTAFNEYGTTLPASSLKTVKELGLLFFGGVGDPKLDETLGKENPGEKPEAKCLLAIRKELGLLLNFRPIIYYQELKHLAKIRPEYLTKKVVKQIWIRFLLEDSYFGNADLIKKVPPSTRKAIGLKLKPEVKPGDEMVSELAYYRRETLLKYLRAAFAYARDNGLPVISIDKYNVMARYAFWRAICEEVAKEFPGVVFNHQLVDSANALLFTPEALEGVIACGNEHGDILSDGAAAALGSMGLMCSSAVNPDTGWAMFESGAGTAPTLAGQDKANPLGRILTGAMLLRHIGANKGADAIEAAVIGALAVGYRTGDLFAAGKDDPAKLLGTAAMGERILSILTA